MYVVLSRPRTTISQTPDNRSARGANCHAADCKLGERSEHLPERCAVPEVHVDKPRDNCLQHERQACKCTNPRAAKLLKDGPVATLARTQRERDHNRIDRNRRQQEYHGFRTA